MVNVTSFFLQLLFKQVAHISGAICIGFCIKFAMSGLFIKIIFLTTGPWGSVLGSYKLQPALFWFLKDSSHFHELSMETFQTLEQNIWFILSVALRTYN